MKTTINLQDFRRAFADYDRADNFSYEGLQSLFFYLEDLESDCGIEMELDVIAICCDFTEYADLEEIQSNYPDIESIEELEEGTTVIEFSGGIIIQNY